MIVKLDPKQGILNFSDRIKLDIEKPLYFRGEKVFERFKNIIINRFYSSGLIPENHIVSLLFINGTSVQECVRNTMGRVNSSDKYFIEIYTRYQYYFHDFINEYMGESVRINTAIDANSVYSDIINVLNQRHRVAGKLL
ncbi:MAG: hypothetical protein JXR36_13010, partial [Bacteroidales bacterium]|nr:hypothetical protein [Bacteroidales bacterium]